MQNSYRMSIRNAPSMNAIGGDNGGDNARLAFGACFMLWMGSIAATWSVIAFIFSLL